MCGAHVGREDVKEGVVLSVFDHVHLHLHFCLSFDVNGAKWDDVEATVVFTFLLLFFLLFYPPRCL